MQSLDNSVKLVASSDSEFAVCSLGFIYLLNYMSSLRASSISFTFVMTIAVCVLPSIETCAGQTPLDSQFRKNSLTDENEVNIDRVHVAGDVVVDDVDRPWLKGALANHPDTEQWREQAAAHRAQPRTPGWIKFEAYALSSQRDVLAMPTFVQMASADRDPSHLLVRLQSGTDPLSLAHIGLVHRRSLTASMPDLSLHRYHFSTEHSFLEIIERTNSHPAVIYAEPDYAVQAPPTQAGPDEKSSLLSD